VRTQSIEAMPAEALEDVDVATLETALFALRDLISRYGRAMCYRFGLSSDQRHRGRWS
jgi:hypothetical protein